MSRVSRIVRSLVFGCTVASALSAQQPVPPAADLADVASADAILAALYDVISAPAGQPRNWDRMRSLFAPGARLIPVVPRRDGGFATRVLSVEDWIAQAEPYFRQNGFFEREVARRSESFGQLVHAFSTYESRHAAADSAPFQRGINSIHLMNDGQRWWVVTIMWDAERASNPIPARYLATENH